MLLPNPNMIDRFACARVNGLKDETFENMMRDNINSDDYKQNYYNSIPRLQNCINEIVDEPSKLTNINTFGNQQNYNKAMTSNLDNNNFAINRNQNMITQADKEQQQPIQTNQQKQTKEGYEVGTNSILNTDMYNDSNNYDTQIMNTNNEYNNNVNNNCNDFDNNNAISKGAGNKCNNYVNNYTKSFFDKIHAISNRDIFIIIISLICMAIFFTIIGITIYRNKILNNKLDNVIYMVQMNTQNNQQLSQEQKEINNRIQKNIYDKVDGNGYNINQPIFSPPQQEQRMLSPQVPIKQTGFL